MDTSKPPVTHSKVLDAVARSLTLLGNSNLIHRFRATRPLALEYEANILTFLMLVNDGAPDGLQCHPAHAHEIRQGETPPPAAGASTPARSQQPPPGDQPTQQQFLGQSLHREPKLRPTPVYLRNPHNVCYLNASLTGLLWAGEIAEQPADCFGVRASAFRALTTGTARKPVYVPGLFNWASLLQGWRNLTQQQDAAEFSDFLLERLLPPAFQGAWEARLNDGSGTECRDRGFVPPSLPLPLTVPESTVSLQALVDAWHHQEATFAFTRAPRFCSCS